MKEKINKYLSTLGRSVNTVETYRWALLYYMEEIGGELNNESYERFLETLKHYSPSTKLVMRSAVMGLYDFCEIPDRDKRERLNEHYTEKVKSSQVNFNRNEIEKVISYCDSLQGDLVELRDRAFVLILADSGLRISELVSLKRGDVDWLERRAAVKGKGNKPALVRFSARSIEALLDYINARMDGARGKPLNSLPLFAQVRVKKLKPITSDGMRKAIKQRMVEAGVSEKDVRMHDFRHYFVTVALIASGNLKVAQELARHESTITTQRYAHFSEHELDETYNSIFNEKDTNNGRVQKQGKDDAP